ncbi:hypothetical protein [Arthrobacter sp. zg-Y238]|uniref:hypothetical protein n=1 Tax=Arthrobacter sp. zg-Y238 TaxID=2964614 RepID=UPI0021044F91|nr:hypothetical protein [Arthrobacter sp. zg-Y238]MCQ1954110.1 hypothetical protein [Arthrobacter sp. zg-Y238]
MSPFPAAVRRSATSTRSDGERRGVPSSLAYPRPSDGVDTAILTLCTGSVCVLIHCCGV